MKIIWCKSPHFKFTHVRALKRRSSICGFSLSRIFIYWILFYLMVLSSHLSWECVYPVYVFLYCNIFIWCLPPAYIFMLRIYNTCITNYMYIKNKEISRSFAWLNLLVIWAGDLLVWGKFHIINKNSTWNITLHIKPLDGLKSLAPIHVGYTWNHT